MKSWRSVGPISRWNHSILSRNPWSYLEMGPTVSLVLPRISFLVVTLMCCGLSCAPPQDKPPPQAAQPPAATELQVMCGSSMAKPMEVLAKRFEEETKTKVSLTLGGCETLLPQLELGVPVDIFIGHSPFDALLLDKGLRQDEMVSLGAINPTVVVLKGNPKGLTGLADMGKEGIRVGLPDARYSTCGEMFEKEAQKQGLLDAIRSRTVFTARTHQELATAILTGSVDVVVVWNFIAASHPGELEAVPTGGVFPSQSVFATLVKKPLSPALAEQFLAFMGRESSRKVFVEMGYQAISAPVAAAPEKARLSLYCAAGLQKPIDALIALFKTKHPEAIFETIYGGSGTLLAQIPLNPSADLFVAADDYYMDQIEEKGLLTRAERIAVMTPALVTPAGNPKQLQRFEDLAREGLRVGLGDARAAAIGRTSEALFIRLNMWPQVQKNVVITAGTVDQLAIQVSSGGLDAAVLWDATAWQFRDRLDIVARGDESSRTGVPVGLLKSAKRIALAEAFIALATAPEAAEVLRQYGFEPAPAKTP